MKRLLLLLSIVFVFLVSTCFSQDSPVVEAAKKEKERRAHLKSPARVLTNQDIDKFKAAHPTSGGSDSQTQTNPTEQTDQQQAGKKEEKAPVPLSDNEEYWRGRAEAIAKQISDLQQRADQLQSDINALWVAGTSASNGQQTVLIGAQRGERMEELKQVQQQLEEAKQNQENLQDEARKEGAPPGWVAPPR